MRLGLVLCLMAFALRAGAQQAQGGPIYLDHADSLKNIAGAQEMRHFMGHVKFHQGNVVISCNDAVHNLTTNIAELNSNVVVTQDTLVITAPHAVYNANTQVSSADGGVRLTDHVVVLTAANGTYDMSTHIATFHNHVKIVNDTAVITSDHLVYNRATEISYATSNVTVIDSSGIITCDRLTNDRIQQRSYCGGHVCIRRRNDPTLIFGDTLYHDSRKDYTVIPIHPLLIHIDSSTVDKVDSHGGHTQMLQFDTMFISSKTMEAFRGDSEVYNAYDSVHILRTDLCGHGGEAHFFPARDVITLSKNPITWYGDTQLTGDSITAYLRNKRMDKLVSDRNAFGVSRGDSLFPLRYNQLSGARITMQFKNDSLNTVRAEKNAISVYFEFENVKPKGSDRTSGDTITIKMLHGQPDKVIALGGAEGQYYPEKYVKKNEPDFRLEGFAWRVDEKPKRKDFVVPPHKTF